MQHRTSSAPQRMKMILPVYIVFMTGEEGRYFFDKE
jgi:hypothetical protein